MESSQNESTPVAVPDVQMDEQII
jgi:serine/threonine protein kinase